MGVCVGIWVEAEVAVTIAVAGTVLVAVYDGIAVLVYATGVCVYGGELNASDVPVSASRLSVSTGIKVEHVHATVINKARGRADMEGIVPEQESFMSCGNGGQSLR